MFCTLTSSLRRTLASSLAATLSCLTPIAAHAAIGIWLEPGMDRWFHQGDSAPGLKPDMSTFSNYDVGAAFSQGRSGSFMLGFDTSDQIPLVAANRYQINSIRFTLDYVHDGRSVTYDPTADSLSAILNNSDDAGRPIELYGVGYDNGYDKLGFGANDSLPPEFEEESPLWPNDVPTLEQTFNVFPLGEDGTGNFGNVFNSPGGEGEFTYNEAEEEFELVEVTKEAWNTTPWAIGTTTAVAAGQLIPEGARFHFEVNLALPGVLDYFQQALSEGQVAAFFSSLHDVSGFHSGGLSEDFPAFHSKESLWVEFEIAWAPRLEIDYEILPGSVPGDFDTDGDVDGRDFLVWQRGGSPSALSGSDLSDWQAGYGMGTVMAIRTAATGSSVMGASPVPEPASLQVLIIGTIMGLNLRSIPTTGAGR